MENKYWTQKQDTLISWLVYYSNSPKERNWILNKLSPTFYEIATRVLSAKAISDTEDNKQDIVLHLVEKAIPGMLKNPELSQGALQYLWVCANNYAVSYLYPKVNDSRVVYLEDPYNVNRYRPEIKAECDYLVRQQHSAQHMNHMEANDADAMNPKIPFGYVKALYTTTPNEPYELDLYESLFASKATSRQEAVTKVNIRISTLLKQSSHPQMNARREFLLLLKSYLNENDYDIAGFGKYVRSKMSLDLTWYRCLSSRLGFTTRDFNEKLIPIHN